LEGVVIRVGFSDGNQFPAMKSKRTLILLLAGLALAAAGCSSTQSRATRSPEFSAWSPAVQQTVLAGKIDIGFSREQVHVALGAPDYSYTRTSADGTTEVWGYRDHGPRFSFGVGVGSFHGRTATSTGIGVSTGGRVDEKVRVVFDRMGRVATVEEATRG
jgi:hypothetical protein